MFGKLVKKNAYLDPNQNPNDWHSLQFVPSDLNRA